MRVAEAVGLVVALSGLMLCCKAEPKPEHVQRQAEQRAAQLAEEAEAALATTDKAPAKADPQAALRDFQQAMQEQLRPDLEPVPASTLKALLPKSITGLEAVAIVDAPPASGALKISTASAHFRSGKSDLSLQIADMGALKAFSDFANTGWVQAEIDRTTAEGHERTLRFEGFRAYEQSERASGAQSLKLVVAKRFMVQAQGQGLTMAEVKAAARRIDLKRLAALRQHGVRTPASK